MKITIELDESNLQRYVDLHKERTELLKTMHERIPLYKNPKKLEKDVVYKDASYRFVIAGIEANNIKDKVFQVINNEWKKQNESES